MSEKSKKIKEADTDHPIHELLTRRWSARAFASKPISDDSLQSFFEAARWSPSSMNAQPWMYIYAHKSDTEAYEKLSSCIMDGNKQWCDNAPLLILSLANTIFTASGDKNRHALHDVGSANTSLLIQAASMNVYGHMLGGFHYERTRKVFKLPKHLEPVCFIALGYLDDPENLEEPFRTREVTARVRKKVGEFVFKGGL